VLLFGRERVACCSNLPRVVFCAVSRSRSGLDPHRDLVLTSAKFGHNVHQAVMRAVCRGAPSLGCRCSASAQLPHHSLCVSLMHTGLRRDDSAWIPPTPAQIAAVSLRSRVHVAPC
jgi:hypothetical protein